eukprot:Gb_06964 [translate_table: standard]
MATHLGASSFYSYFVLSSHSPASNGATTRRNFIVKAEQKSRDQNKQGWFYNTFVSNQTMDAKLEKFKGDVAARNGFVGSWFNDSFKYTAWIERSWPIFALQELKQKFTEMVPIVCNKSGIYL